MVGKQASSTSIQTISQLKTLTPTELFIGFSKIGLSGFGGVLPWARRTLVEKEKWLSSEEFSAMLGICQLVPGPNIINLAVCVGSRYAGIRGALAAILGLILGPIAIVILLGLLYDHYSYMPMVQGMLRGVSAVGIGLVGSTGFKMMRTEFSYPPMLIVTLLTLIAALYFKLGLGWVVLITLPIALYLAWKKATRA
jgi:chromate transporter